MSRGTKEGSGTDESATPKRGRGRPRLPGHLLANRNLGRVRVSSAIRDLLHNAAADDGVDLSEWSRDLLEERALKVVEAGFAVESGQKRKRRRKLGYDADLACIRINIELLELCRNAAEMRGEDLAVFVRETLVQAACDVLDEDVDQYIAPAYPVD